MINCKQENDPVGLSDNKSVTKQLTEYTRASINSRKHQYMSLRTRTCEPSDFTKVWKSGGGTEATKTRFDTTLFIIRLRKLAPSPAR